MVPIMAMVIVSRTAIIIRAVKRELQRKVLEEIKIFFLRKRVQELIDEASNPNAPLLDLQGGPDLIDDKADMVVDRIVSGAQHMRISRKNCRELLPISCSIFLGDLADVKAELVRGEQIGLTTYGNDILVFR